VAPSVRIEGRDGGPFEIVASDDELAVLRRRFDERHHVVLPGLLGGRLLDRVLEEVERAEFIEHEHPLKRELLMLPNAATVLLWFVTNDPRLFAVVDRITGSGPFGSVWGRLFRMLPGPEHWGVWHDDEIEERRAALSLNLSTEPCEGGILEIRDVASGEIVAEAKPGKLGDAILFRIARGLEHRVTPLAGRQPKTTFVGFFRGGEPAPVLRPSGRVASRE
jgi:hypothetical protein